ncbi:hypothetical protein BH23GEM9_BH23GEM9_32790 [soil metagenome]
MHRHWYLGLRCVAWCAAIVGCVSSSAVGQTPTREVDDVRVLAQIWSALRFQHPWVAAEGTARVDSALVAAIRQTRASSGAPLAALVADFLSVLNDPATRVLDESLRPRFAIAEAGPSITMGQDGAAIIRLNRYSDVSVVGALPDTEKRIANVLEALKGASALVLDVRADAVSPRTPDDIYWTRDLIERILRHATSMTVAVPVLRDVVRTDFPSEWRAGDGGRASRFAFYQVPASSHLAPAAGARDLPTVILANVNSELPAYAAALARAGRIVLLTEGNISDAPFIRYRDITIDPQNRARVRLAEVLHDDGTGGVAATVLADTSAAAVVASAYELIQTGWPIPGSGPRLPVLPLEQPTAVSDEPLPAQEERVFALLKVWASIEAFYPTQSLPRWETVLQDFLPVFLESETPLDYHLAVARLMNRLEDSHASLASPLVARWRGNAVPPLQLATVEGQVIVKNVTDDSIHGGFSVRAGDVVLSIDGEDALARGWRLTETLSYSTPARGAFHAGDLAALGELGVPVTMTLRDSQQDVYTVTLPRVEIVRVRRDIQSRSPPVRWVAPDIGYINVARVTEDSVDAAFAHLAGARAIVFDWRGYGASFPFVARLLVRDSVPLETVRPYLGHLGAGWWSAPHGTLTTTTLCTGCRAVNGHYSGLAALLTGPQPQSSMEVNAAILRAANNTPFVGEPTSGTLGGVFVMYLPGGLRLQPTSGAGPDRIGLQPDFPVSPTIQGVREGRDEVLDAAVALLQARLREHQELR